MIRIKNTVISEDLISEDFVCNLSSCKGSCCVEGEAGAPLNENEVLYLQKNYSKIKPFLNPKGKKSIESQGVFVKGIDGEYETPLVDGKECSYAVFSENEIISCGIENAYNEGKIEFKKPISCHLYPVRINNYSGFTAVNYHKWSICNSACSLGKSLKVPVYKFLKEALIRKFGKKWFLELEKNAKKRKS